MPNLVESVGTTCTAANSGWKPAISMSHENLLEDDETADDSFRRLQKRMISLSLSAQRSMHFMTITADSIEDFARSSETEVDLKIICSLCCHPFPSSLSLQVHLFTQKHPPLDFMRTVEYQNDPRYRCTVCNTSVSYNSDAKSHHCFQDRCNKIRMTLSLQMREFASPFVCVYCNSRKFKNRFALNIHIIMRHIRNAGKSRACPICKCVFKTTNAVVMEMHGLQEHLPEIMMIYRRMVAGELRTPITVSTPFVCLYPYEQNDGNKHESNLYVSRESYCEKEFGNVCALSAHLVAVHGTVDVAKKAEKRFRVFCADCRPVHGFLDTYSLLRHIGDTHQFSADNHAILSTRDMTFKERYNADCVCFLCWVVFPTNLHLQAHISCAHVTIQWRACDSCGREYCGADERMSDKLISLTIEKHEEHHVSILKEHMDILNQPGDLPTKVPMKMPEPTYFAEIQILNWKELMAAKAKPVLSEKALQHFMKLRNQNKDAQTELLFLDLI